MFHRSAALREPGDARIGHAAHRGRFRTHRRPAASVGRRVAPHRPLPDPPALLPLRRGCGAVARGLFARLIERTHYQPAAFAAQLRQLFAVMATGGWFGVERIPHFNGGLFDDDTALELDGESMDVLARVAGARLGRHRADASSARCSSAASTRTSARSSARTTPARRISC